MVFQPGQSGNPGGRQKKDTTIIDLARAASPEAIAKIIELAKNSSDPKIQIQACREILDRGYGKAAQAVELSGAEGEPLKIGITFNLKDTKKQLPPSDTD
jgi:hypothetical protein